MITLQKIIALSGPRACGKSTIAGHLITQKGYNRLAFADVLREIASLYSQDSANNRIFLSELGDKLREFVPDFFLQVMERRLISAGEYIVIEDIRFPAELEFCKAIGATTIRLKIPVETQLNNLVERGSNRDDAKILVNCQDEFLLDETCDWDFIIPAVGDFRTLASEIHILVNGDVESE